MNKENRDFAERVLKQLCIGAKIDGLRFGVSSGATQVYLTKYEGFDDLAGQLYLNIESKWTIFDSVPSQYPSNESQIADVSEEEKYSQIIKVRREKIIDIQLGDSTPHLIISFESGSILFVIGFHEKYECWQVGVESDNWLVVACPMNGIATWTSNKFE
ncbi:hypothetical protein MHI32_22485 [Paenibacillus sp. FSL H7-0690]|uniref:hypothetical protein n=1 Tax=Paenibacillus sp. FSL H7-0690 TaxID=2921437 RepID=UPI0030EBE159